MKIVTEDKSPYLAAYESLRKKATGRRAPAWMSRLRKEAITRFSELGFPTTQDEDWKYTSVEPIAATRFVPAEPARVKPQQIRGFAFEGLRCAQLVFVNGRYSPALSSPGPLPDGVTAGSLAAVLKSNPEWLEPHLARYASTEGQAFVALNTALHEDGAFVLLPKGTVLAEPIHLVFVSAADGQPAVSHPRSLILMGDGSQARIIESYVRVGPEAYFTNAVTEIVAGQSSVVDHYKVQRESGAAFHVATLQARLERGSTFTTHSFSLGGSLVRNDVNAVLDAEGVDCVLNGLYLATRRQHVDNHTRIDHAQPHGSSRELYKGILAERARGIFNGKVVVRPGAQKTDAKQTNKNLLLSDDALVDTKPQLEIYADDVKCTHGATIGQIDQDAVFYLRTRGVDREAARSLLTYAFASDMVNRVKVEPVRSRLNEILLAWLPGPQELREVA